MVVSSTRQDKLWSHILYLCIFLETCTPIRYLELSTLFLPFPLQNCDLCKNFLSIPSNHNCFLFRFLSSNRFTGSISSVLYCYSFAQTQTWLSSISLCWYAPDTNAKTQSQSWVHAHSTTQDTQFASFLSVCTFAGDIPVWVCSIFTFDVSDNRFNCPYPSCCDDVSSFALL